MCSSAGSGEAGALRRLRPEQPGHLRPFCHLSASECRVLRGTWERGLPLGIPVSGRLGRCCSLAAVPSRNKRSLSTYCVPDSVLGTGEAAGNRMRLGPGLTELVSWKVGGVISFRLLEATQGFARGLAHSRWLILSFFLMNGDYQTPGGKGPATCVGAGSAAIPGLEVAATMPPGSGRNRVPREGALCPAETTPTTPPRRPRERRPGAPVRCSTSAVGDQDQARRSGHSLATWRGHPAGH